MYDTLNFKEMNKKLNNLTFTDYFYRLSLIALSIFKWDNLPNGINERWIEKYLFDIGECMFFKDPILGFRVSKSIDKGINVYNEPIDLEPESTGLTEPKTYKNGIDAVLIKNNDLSIPTLPTLQLYAYRLADLTRAQDVNITAQKTPILIITSDRQKLTMKNVFNQWSGNEPVIYGDKEMNIDGVKVLKTDAPIVFDKIQIQKHQLWNEVMTFLGVNNANQDKKERLVDDEVQANNEQVKICLDVMLKARQSACNEINRIFGTNIKVSARIGIESKIDELNDELNNEIKESEVI